MLNVIYCLVNKQNEKIDVVPNKYVGSKVNYKPGKYWGSSRHPVLLKELSEDISVFSVEILEYVNDPKCLVQRELYWQEKFDVVNSEEYFNLAFANQKFTSLNFRWYYDPISLDKGYFPKHKIPNGWLPGKKPKEKDSKQYPKNVTTPHEKISYSLKGQKKSADMVKKMKNTKREQSPHYQICHNKDLVYDCIDLRSFAERENLSFGSVYECVRKRGYYKSYTFERTG